MLAKGLNANVGPMLINLHWPSNQKCIGPIMEIRRWPNIKYDIGPMLYQCSMVRWVTIRSQKSGFGVSGTMEGH